MTADRLPTLEGQSCNGGGVLARSFSILQVCLAPDSRVTIRCRRSQKRPFIRREVDQFAHRLAIDKRAR